jgi:hypothetical protein
MDVVMWGREPIGGSFALIDHNGQHRTDADFRGKLLLIYFGFAACSDVCPTDLQAIAGAVDKLGPTGGAAIRGLPSCGIFATPGKSFSPVTLQIGFPAPLSRSYNRRRRGNDQPLHQRARPLARTRRRSA